MISDISVLRLPSVESIQDLLSSTPEILIKIKGKKQRIRFYKISLTPRPLNPDPYRN